MVASEQTLLTSKQLDTLSINTIRTLAMDAVQQANSGHPGAPMALAPVAYCLWQQFLRYDPEDPLWPNRDRFVLSNGHASMLLYALLYLAGVRAVNSKYERQDQFAITLDDIKKFRQINSKTPGHPEYRLTSGVETTTGPLGQGVGNSVGMAMAGMWLAANYNRPGFELFDYNVYAMCGDGDMMEGVASEAASLAAHLNQQTKDRPTLIIVDSHIGYGAPHKQDTSAAHGEPLGEDEVKLAKKFYGWPEDAKFLVPGGVREHFHEGIGKRGSELHQQWTKRLTEYGKKYPDLADQLNRMQRHELPDGWDKNLPTFPADAKGIATRESSGKVLNIVAQNVPWLIGGSADLATSNKTTLKFEGAGDFQAGHYGGRNLHFGVREHGMGAALSGMALSLVRPFGGTFFNFSDYMRPPIRLASIMELPVIYVFTHDSIGLGEDGPTHQPVEQLAALRAVPGLVLLRPADANEVVEAWKVIMLLREQPAALVLTRQNVPTLDRSKYASASGVAKGAYILADTSEGLPQVILMGSGSEISLCVDAYEQLKSEGIKARVVSMPSWDIFEHQDEAYRNKVLPPQVKARVAVEQASTFGWAQYVGPTGKVIGMKTFGASAPLKELLKKFGFTPDKVVEAAKEAIASSK